MRKKSFALILFSFGISLIITFKNLNITGNTILESVKQISITNILGLIFILGSFILFVGRKGLDAIVIPTGGGVFDPEENMNSQDRDRAKTAVEYWKDLEKGGYFVISGYTEKNKEKPLNKSQTYSIYKFLRKHGIKPSQMMLEGKSHDTLENVLYTLKKVKAKEQKDGDRKPWDVAFVSYPGHLERFEDFEKQAIKRGLFEEKDFNFYKIPTNRKDSPDEEKYENFLLRKISHFIKLATIDKYKQKIK